MTWKTVFGITLTLSISMLTLAVNIPTIKANGRVVGVEVGDWARYDFAFSWTGTLPPGYEDTKNIEWLMIEVTAISGTEITFDGTLHFKNGTETTVTGIPWDVDPSWIYLHSIHWFIGAELEAGDIMYPSSGWSAKINETEIQTYAGASREVNHFNGTVSQYSYCSYIDCYWDKQTGILAEQSLEQHSLRTPTDSISMFLVMVETNIWSPTYTPVEVDVAPESLNLRSRGKWINCYIALPQGFKAKDVDVSTIMLNGTIPAEIMSKGRGAPHLMVKFDRQAVTDLILRNYRSTDKFGTETLTITGCLNDGTPFQGSDTIRIILFMPRSWRFLETLEIFPI